MDRGIDCMRTILRLLRLPRSLFRRHFFFLGCLKVALWEFLASNDRLLLLVLIDHLHLIPEMIHDLNDSVISSVTIYRWKLFANQYATVILFRSHCVAIIYLANNSEKFP
ncbi:hypothetical protein ACH3XW_6680 [Acanthocheilonema viteae]